MTTRRRRTGALTALTLLVACLTAVTATAPPARAAGELAASITPIRLEMTADRGKTVTADVKVRNVGSKELSITAGFQDFVAHGESGEPSFVPTPSTAQSLSGWISAKPASFTLKPGKQQTVRLTINVPKRAEPGGHYAAALFGSTPTGKKQTQVVAKVGSLILLTVRGAIREALSVTLSTSRFIEAGQAEFTFRAVNSGNVHVKPTGVVLIDPVLGGHETTATVPAENVLPDSARQTTVHVDQLPIGLCRISAIVNYGTTNKAAASTEQLVLVMPWRIVVACAVMFTLGILAALSLVRMVGRRHRAGGIGRPS